LFVAFIGIEEDGSCLLRFFVIEEEEEDILVETDVCCNGDLFWVVG